MGMWYRGVEMRVGVIWLRLWAGLMLKVQPCLKVRPFLKWTPDFQHQTSSSVTSFKEKLWNFLYNFLFWNFSSHFLLLSFLPTSIEKHGHCHNMCQFIWTHLDSIFLFLPLLHTEVYLNSGNKSSVQQLSLYCMRRKGKSVPYFVNLTDYSLHRWTYNQ